MQAAIRMIVGFKDEEGIAYGWVGRMAETDVVV
jgi:hypothetical protein